ncbi:hypothetical protein QQG74_05815 [Micromonospora sp. FIMYZ51]|uniref:hypothetical protein n=1 Tax=Micromonospora sp. FIMYZ51 TaxID=3051832 RepID=UPI00311EC2F7
MIAALRAIPRRRLLVAAGAVALILLAGAGIGWSQLRGDDTAPGWSAGSPGPDPAAASGPTESDPTPSGSAESRPKPPSGGSATGTPAPRIHPFANELSGATRTAAPSPTARLKMAEGLDGCDHGYGERGVCVPWTLPAGVTDACAWLRERDYPPLPVNNPRDRHNLDRNKDGVACGPGD